MTADRPASGPEDSVDADAFKGFEAAGWEHQAPTYDSFFGRLTSQLVDPLLDAAGVGPDMRVLDIATGPGYAAAKAAERGATVVGVDIAPSMVRLASQLHPTLEFREAAAEALPFQDSSFDAAVSNFLIPHLGRHALVVGELVRVLRDDGRVSLTTWDFPERMRLLGIFLDAFSGAGAAPPDDIPVGPPFFRFADDDQFIALLSDNGLTDVDVSTVAFSHHTDSADQLWEGMLTGTVRTSAFFLGQPEETRRRVRSTFDRLALDYRRGENFEWPVSVKLARARKAG